MTDPVPPWLLEMRAISGLAEKPGEADEPKILAMRDYIADKFPDMAKYCSQYHHDSIPWCGLAAAYCMARADIRPPFGATDTDKFLWARSWAESTPFGIELKNPKLGCVVVLTRSGGGHVTFYESTSGDNYKCRGGNQSDAVNVQSYPKKDVVALIWPADEVEDLIEHETVQKGDSGADVKLVQLILGIPDDGEFGPLTETQVKAFQLACAIDADGIVGPDTWEELEALGIKINDKSEDMSDGLMTDITALVAASPVKVYAWPDRGVAPIGYLNGMALSFAFALKWLAVGHPGVELMAAGAGNADVDALKWYDAEFKSLGMDNRYAGTDTLRHLFVLLIGLGMRESSGQYCEGKDASATNTTSDTCEAGLFQTSWNIASASDEIEALLRTCWDNPNGFLPSFSENVNPSPEDLRVYGTGDGARYQFLAKYSPLFAVLTTAIGLRLRRKHWGPVNRMEVDLVEEVDELLQAIQQLMEDDDATDEIVQDQIPVVDISIGGDVILIVNGKRVVSP